MSPSHFALLARLTLAANLPLSTLQNGLDVKGAEKITCPTTHFHSFVLLLYRVYSIIEPNSDADFDRRIVQRHNCEFPLSRVAPIAQTHFSLSISAGCRRGGQLYG
jgi:hypothetical protein